MSTPQKDAQPEKPMTRFEAQRKLGLFAPHDYVTVILLFILWITLAYWWLFGTPTANQLIGFALFNIFLMQAWSIILAYRCLVFCLDIQADINLLPEAAARIAAGFLQGKK